MLRIKASKIKLAAKIITPVALVAGSFGFMGYQVYESAPAKALNMQFSKVGTHPRASALIDHPDYGYYGPRLHDLAISGGKLYAGYGDWNTNSDSWGPAEGRTALVPFNLTTHTFESQNEVMVGSEAITNIREINGSLYVPSIDPSIHGTGGYATNQSGTWEVKGAAPDAVHVFDVASLGTGDLWLFGARDNYPPFDGSVGRAVAWRSTDNGQTWNEAFSQGSDPGQGAGFERYYWGQRAGSKVFMHASGTVPELPTVAHDGTSSTDYPNVTCGSSGHRVVEFQDKIICNESYIDQTYYQLIAINGDGSATPLPSPGSGYIEDYYVHAGYLYALGSDGSIFRTNDLQQNWTSLGKWTYPGQDYVTATSIAVYNDKIYIGDSKANIYEAGTTITAELNRSGIETCFEFDGNGTITEYYDRENDNPANPECSKNVIIPAEIDGEPVTTIGEYAFESKSVESVTIPSSVTAIQDSAFSDNSLDAVALPSGLTTIGPYAFSGNSLSSVVIPNSLVTLGVSAFSSNQLTSLGLPNGLASIPRSAFSYNRLTSVTIPSSVTSVGIGAFEHNAISTLVLPNSIQSIGESAFYSNNLRSLTLPSGLTVIEPMTFAGNKIKQAVIPSGVTEIDPSSFSEQSEMQKFSMPISDSYKSLATMSDPAPTTLNEYLDSIWYVRLYTQDPANPNGLVSGAWVEHIDETEDCVEMDSLSDGQVHASNCDVDVVAASCGDDSAPQVSDSQVGIQSYCTGDMNGDGDADDIFDANFGGHLINPAFVALHSETTSGKELAEPRTLSGKTGDRYVEGYMVKDGPALQPTVIEDEVVIPWNVTAAAVNDPNTITLADSYYRVGQTIQVPASFFPGYSLASGNALVSITLTSAVTEHTFVYELTDPSQVPGAPDTGGGVALSIGVLIAIVASIVGGIAFVRFRRNKIAI